MSLKDLANKFSGKIEEIKKEAKVDTQELYEKIEEIYNEKEDEIIEYVLQEPLIEEKEEVKEVETADELLEEVEILNETREIELEELEEIVEEAIRDFPNQQSEEEIQVNNNQLFELLLSIKRDIIDTKREELIIDNKIFRQIEKATDVIKEVNIKYSKTAFTIMAILFVLGVLFGMQDEKWMPYLSSILDFARTTTNVIK